MLNVVNLHAGYASKAVLHGVSFTLPEGEVLAVCGPNGAGKSTLLKALSGQLIPTSGQWTFEGHSIKRVSPAELVRRGIALVPEGRKIFPRMSVEANLRIGGYSRGDRKAVTEEVASFLKAWPVIERRRKSPAGLLSGGEQQILAIGRSLMSRPKLLMLDEPSLGLAPVLIEQVYQALKDLAAEGHLTVLLVEQNVVKALELCDRMAVLSHGAIAYESSAADTNAEQVGQHYFSARSGGV